MNELSELSMITGKIHIIRGVQVMLDSDLAELYQVETSSLNRQVKRNIERFPADFCFQLNEKEYENLKCQIGFSSSHGGRRTLPFVFTEQGVSMLSGVIHTDVSIRANIHIMRSFVAMRHYLSDNALVFQRIDRLELKGLETDEKFNLIFKQLETPKQANAIIFFKGQMWDAVSCIEEIIGKAEKTIILIDGYVDKGTLDMLSRKKPKASVQIYTNEFHDRFLILDKRMLYHIGASIKDAGKKAFEISLNEDEKLLSSLLSRLQLPAIYT